MKVNKKSIVAALIGHVLERYDVALYGYFSAMLAPIFFSTENASAALIASLGAFAAGYLMRPLGGIIFGYFGDRYGRKKAFTWSIVLVIIPTFIIGVLPSYAQIGIAAPIILITCRLMQGLCNGGEFSGAGIFVGEHTPTNRVGFTGSMICATGLLGAAFGTLFGAIVTLPMIPSWGWRIPFLVGSCLTFISYFIRRRMIETPVFQEVLEKECTLKNPLKEVFRNYKFNILNTIAIGGCGHILVYMPTIYMNVVYTTILKTPNFQILIINTGILGLWVILSPIMGYLADKVGIRQFMSGAAMIAILIAYPLFSFLEANLNLEGVIIFQLILTVIGSAFVAPISGLFVSLFPVRERYSGVAFSITLGQALFGGTTPLISTFLTNITGDFKAPAFFMMFGGTMGCLAVIRMMQFPVKLQGELPHLIRDPLDGGTIKQLPLAESLR
ncbi:MAG: MFS transporter [Alphaproteobacteria bacterium]|nr:MFS transporter [Alphaproteobacteria bacterium]